MKTFPGGTWVSWKSISKRKMIFFFQFFFSESFWLNKPLAKDSILGFFIVFLGGLESLLGPTTILKPVENEI